METMARSTRLHIVAPGASGTHPGPAWTEMGRRMEDRRSALGLSRAEALHAISVLREKRGLGEALPQQPRWIDWMKKDPAKMELRTLLDLATVLQTTVDWLVTGERSAPEANAVRLTARQLEAMQLGALTPSERATLESVRFYGHVPTKQLVQVWLTGLRLSPA